MPSASGSLVLTEDGKLFHEDVRKAVDQVLLAEEQLAAHQAIRNHHLLIGAEDADLGETD